MITGLRSISSIRFCTLVLIILLTALGSANAQQRIEGTKSPLAAAALSFVVPGLGEAYATRFDAGKYFSGSEAILWGTYAGLSIYSNDYRNDMESFGIANAGAGASRRGDQDYFAHVGQYQSAELFNEEMMREGKNNALILNPQEQWQWTTKDDQNKFNNLRIKAQTLDNDRQFAVAAIVINHVLSAIDAFIVSRRYNKSLTEGKASDKSLNETPENVKTTKIEFGGKMGALIDPKGASLMMRVEF